MDDRRSHWPIYDIVPIEMIETISEAVRGATVDTVANKDGKVVYFLVRSKRNEGNSTKYLKREE